MYKQTFFNSNFYFIALHFFLFFYIYSIQFIGVPFNAGTRVIFGVLGFLFFIMTIINRKSIYIDKNVLAFVKILFFMSLMSAMGLLYNMTFDIEFLFKYQFSIVLMMFSSYFIYRLISLKETVNVDLLLFKIVINVILIQNLLSLIMFFNQPLRDFLNGIQYISEFETSLLEKTGEFRLNGFGAKFFGAGVVNGLALMLIGSLIKFESSIRRNVFKYSFYYIMIFAVGMMMARTTLIGAFLSLIIMTFPRNKIKKSGLIRFGKFLFYLIVIPLIVVFLLFFIFPEIKESFETLFQFGFEMFRNYFSSGKLESNSTNEMSEMYIWPESIKTYFVGDGLFTDPNSGFYYKGTDIGILRVIYYFGIPGLLLYLGFQFKIVYCTLSNIKEYRIMYFIVIIYIIILNFKGVTDLSSVLLLFYFVSAKYNVNKTNVLKSV